MMMGGRVVVVLLVGEVLRQHGGVDLWRKLMITQKFCLGEAPSGRSYFFMSKRQVLRDIGDTVLFDIESS
jgi:hypothetical protein